MPRLQDHDLLGIVTLAAFGTTALAFSVRSPSPCFRREASRCRTSV